MPLVLEKPNYPPYVCLVCGVGERRKWFVDLQLPIDNYFNPVTAGAVYLCNECWDSVALETNKQAQILLLGVEPWSDSDYVAPTYDNEKELVSAPTLRDRIESGLSTRGTNSRTVSNRIDEGTDTSTPEDNRSTERNDQTPEPNDTDEQAQPLREFGSFFGGKSPGD